ncbi:hypothetical protein ACHAXN_003187 [Cyclotella atomus]
MAPTKRSRASTGTDAAKKQAEYKRRRKKDQDYSKHAFLDASATVHAGLFAARRLPEIKSLWRGLVDDAIESGSSGVRKVGHSGGGKISCRHLRRRTGSHRPRRRHRFPRGDYGRKTSTDDDGLEIDSEPNSVDFEALVSRSNAIASGNENADSKQPSTKKRQNESKPRCRRARRKPALLKAVHSRWWSPSELHPNPTYVAENHKWLPTHHWHTKRFHIASLFGWIVPLVHCNRGSRASLRLARDRCTIQDATWEISGCALVLRVGTDGNSTNPVLHVECFLRRICGSDSSVLTDEKVLCGDKLGNGLVYEIDSFPLKLVGPASFLFARNGDSRSVSIMVHPSICSKVQSLLETLISDSGGSNTSLSVKPVSLLRIRGSSSLSTLVDVLSMESQMLMHSGENIEADIDSDTISNHGLVVSFETDQSSTQWKRLSCGGYFSSDLNPNNITIQCQQPNGHVFGKSLPHNAACSGFDIFCHPSMASSLFQAFVMKGACAIGLTEDARAQNEAVPPLPVFPRDFPDTDIGRCYWELSRTERERDEYKSFIDWIVIRTCLEAPSGRMSTSLKWVLKHHSEQQKKSTVVHQCEAENNSPQELLVRRVKTLGQSYSMIQWNGLIPSFQSDDISVLCVRGSFCDPFLAILRNYGKFKSCHSDTTKKHKHRRQYNAIVKASRLSKSQAEAHFSLCNNLLDALSLPAVLRCEITCFGKGTLEPGDLLFPLENIAAANDGSENKERDSMAPLGVVAAGAFSPSRGTYYGVGFVGASRFIEALMHCTVDGMGMKGIDGCPKMMLKVHLRKVSPDCAGRQALLSLLL